MRLPAHGEKSGERMISKGKDIGVIHCVKDPVYFGWEGTISM